MELALEGLAAGVEEERDSVDGEVGQGDNGKVSLPDLASATRSGLLGVRHAHEPPLRCGCVDREARTWRRCSCHIQPSPIWIRPPRCGRATPKPPTVVCGCVEAATRTWRWQGEAGRV
ncbi:Os07g0294700 [Oryza sativa Japonica Group]|jgi:hypothetical protein|uniref:Os07g0294700 protein n=2 Tax=Oryza sativa subsp. japonica TaxID=39947 RepID=Q0D756_ORYSJ|nr:hypothetical protein OsJ_23897 [Oryza sativa Japonica Group]KAB8105062.1 hypothetical protein EE612_038518 [Oryza sativa]KAF2922352.1 hypothetical protein DAI22_07g106600 [Oryza sativa Japonica Group]BAF21317.1 Os07g0294700 [Oryza sativa Japonica Group]BAG99096.1 unnamed protein product [Oryza sativa Japonica Group]|eukprot:NP_001059403.1 Os07g0294700 [Oryza sativa Japonica Group]